MKRKVSSIALNALLLILGVVTVYPFVWMLFSSFKENQEIMALEQHLLPQKFIIDNYINMNAHFNFIRFFLNSIVITVVITLIVIYTSTICGFVLSKYKFKGRNILFGFVLSTMMIPWCVTIIPKYSMIQAFGWMDSYKALIIPAMFSGFGIFMMKQHISALPDEILEAARIDGAKELYIFHRIAIPIMSPGIATMSIMGFIGNWNAYLMPMIILNKNEKFTLPVMMATLRSSTDITANQGAIYLAVAISVIPILLVFAFFSKYIISSIAAGAVKE